MYVMLVCLIPLLIPMGYWLYRRPHIDFLHLAASSATGVFVAGVIYAIGLAVMTSDHEIWNGQVTMKEKDRVSCEHSYECNCTVDSDGKRSCQTCYEHSWDYDWVLHTNVEKRIEIRRIDEQGKREPPRFTRAQVGDTVAVEKSFSNPLKGSEQSLFNTAQAKSMIARWKDDLPKYPENIYDYHYLNRVLPIKVPLPNLEEWNRKLSERLKTLGPKKQANIIVVMTNTPDPTYADGLRAAWLGGKKNDIIVVMGVPEYPKIAWTSVISWTDSEIFKVTLRDHLVDLGTVANVDAVYDVIEKDTIDMFKRKHFEEGFSYLNDSIMPPTWAIWLAVIGGIIGSILTIFLVERHYGRSPLKRTFNQKRSYKFN